MQSATPRRLLDLDSRELLSKFSHVRNRPDKAAVAAELLEGVGDDAKAVKVERAEAFVQEQAVQSGAFGDAQRADLLAEGEGALREGLQELTGLLHYYVGIDRESGYLTNVSVWETLEDAHQMDAFKPMLDQRPILEEAGVRFETITNHETLWTITP